jgi:cytochrome c-type biogenesis protein CcmH/NrfG
MRTLTFAGIGVFVALAAVLLAHNAGERAPGQTITGNAQSRTTVTLDPNSYEGHMQGARAALQSSNYPEAIRQFTQASQVDPTQGEPLAYSGWITALIARSVGDQATKNELLGKAREQLDQAISVAPNYPDSYVFEGLLLSKIENHPCDAVTRFQKFLVLAPADHPMRNDVLSALQNAIQAGKCPGVSTTTTVKQ